MINYKRKHNIYDVDISRFVPDIEYLQEKSIKFARKIQKKYPELRDTVIISDISDFIEGKKIYYVDLFGEKISYGYYVKSISNVETKKYNQVILLKKGHNVFNFCGHYFFMSDEENKSELRLLIEEYMNRLSITEE